MKALLKIMSFLLIVISVSSCSKDKYHYLTKADLDFLGKAIGDTNFVFYNNPPYLENILIKEDHHEFKTIKTNGFVDIPQKEYLETIKRINSVGYIQIQKNQNDVLLIHINCNSFTFSEIIEKDLSITINNKTYNDVYVFQEKILRLYFHKTYGYLKLENSNGEVVFEIRE
jgi:hypothetical protein